MPNEAGILQRVRLFTPGPCMVPEDVLCEMARPQEHHRTKAFVQLAKDCDIGMKYVFQTSQDVVTITGSGTSGMEAAIIGLCPAGVADRKVLVVDGGKFGERWAKVCVNFNITHEVLKVEWGTAVTAAQIEEYLQKNPACPAVILVHSETSTATACDLEAIAGVTRKSDALLIVDGITGIGALPFKMDEWGVDCCVTGSQKAMMLPPGLAFVALNERAKKRIAEVKNPSLYLNLKPYLKGLPQAENPYTPNNQLLRGLLMVVRHIQAVGIEKIWAKTSKLAAATRAGAEAIGMKSYSKNPSDSVTALWVPQGVDEPTLRKTIRAKYGIELAGGQDQLKGKVVRINHMGYVDPFDVAGVLGCLELVLADMGHKFPFGASAAAALPILNDCP